MKKLIALVLALAMILMVGAAFASDPAGDPEGQTPAATLSSPSITINPVNTDGNTESLAINYTWYRILEASIDTDPVVATDGSTTTAGTVAYYVTTQDRATQLTNTNLFNVTKVDGQDKWFVELKNSNTSAESIVNAFSANTFDLTKFASDTFDKTASETNAQTGTIAAGYYYITSSLGTKIALQTLTAVTINEKNTYPTITKEDNKVYVPIDGEVAYTVTVTIPESVANKNIVIYDTITDGLTLNTAATVAGAVADPAYTSATFELTQTNAAVADDPDTTDVNEATKGTKVYTITIPAATVLANKGRTLTFSYSAKLNENAVVMELEHNKAHLTYDNYTTVDVDTDVKTLAFDLQKVDGTDKTTVLTGAEFALYTAKTEGTRINVVLKEAASESNGQVATYRVAKSGETGVAIAAGTARIEGLDQATYWLEETKAPTGYNQLTERVQANATEATSTTTIDYKVENNKGTTLPSTGGIGTTIFYILGGLLVVGAAVILVARRRVHE